MTILDYLDVLDDLARVLALPNLTPAERQEYEECAEQAHQRLAEARGELAPSEAA